MSWYISCTLQSIRSLFNAISIKAGQRVWMATSQLCLVLTVFSREVNLTIKKTGKSSYQQRCCFMNCHSSAELTKYFLSDKEIHLADRSAILHGGGSAQGILTGHLTNPFSSVSEVRIDAQHRTKSASQVCDLVIQVIVFRPKVSPLRFSSHYVSSTTHFCASIRPCNNLNHTITRHITIYFPQVSTCL